MLNPNNDRLYYGDILTPPLDYQLDFAIGTTYSLDLDALVGASISLGLSDEMDSNLSENPIYLLEALRKTSKNVIVFCENGQIKLPNNVTPLYILLENTVFQVKTSKQFNENRYASFHPKFWLLKYINKDNNVQYRLVVLSRNLTFDRSWDISFAINGTKLEESSDENNSIIKFLEYLINFSNDETKTSKMMSIIDELKYIHFDLHSRDFKEFEFFVNGIDDANNINDSPLFSNNPLNELLVVSPFLSNSVISQFNDRKTTDSKALLFTRMNSLGDINSKDCSNFEVYTLKDEIIDGESLFSEEAQEIAKQDIHAKIYVAENDRFTEVYLGSLNASHNALYGNIEVMIKLRAKKNKVNVKKIANDLFNDDKGGPNDPFQIIDMSKDYDKENDGNDMDLVIKYLSKLDSKANIVDNNDSYNIELIFNNLDKIKVKDVDISIKPLLSKRSKELDELIVFDNLDKLSLSEFFAITVRDEDKSVERIIKIPTEGMPEDRQNDVIASIITDETAFIKYVAFLLGDDYILSLVEGGMFSKVNNGITIQLPELYEKMLKASVHSPQKFKELDFLINALSDDNVIPDGFEELYNTFLEVLD